MLRGPSRVEQRLCGGDVMHLVEHDPARPVEMDREEHLRGEPQQQGDEVRTGLKSLEASAHARGINDQFVPVMPDLVDVGRFRPAKRIP